MTNAPDIAARLTSFPAALRTLAACVSDADARWKPRAVPGDGAPSGGHWSIVEICCHLLDEEREDFRLRLQTTLRDPSEAWPPLGLDDIAQRRGYNQRDLHMTITEFASERERSVQWLRSVTGADFTRAYGHPKWGPIRAGDLLCSWAAHDALHLRQIAKRLHNLAERDAKAAGFSVRYAGDW